MPNTHSALRAHAPLASTPLRCACTTLRKAARAMARRYEQRLGEVGVTATQFAILRSLDRLGGRVPLVALADDLVLERTSLYRAIAPLRRAGIVSVSDGPDRRVKTASLTRAGTAKLKAATPYWEASQHEFVRAFGAARWRALQDVLLQVVDVARASP